tara:strand:+ start:5090 stop:5656 length:567 start_codon:yes stop_codon:yes gene_type:complete
LGTGSELATCTDVRSATHWQAISCGIRETPDGRQEGYCEETSGWDYGLSRTERRYRLLYQHDDYARVRLSVRHPLTSGVATTERLRFPPGPESVGTLFPIELTLLEGRAGVVLVVPAGSFTCTYRKVRAYTKQLLPALVETWTDPALPVPLQRIVTWRDPRAPEPYQVNTERTVLLALDRKPNSPASK